jgi:hypothetical protein
MLIKKYISKNVQLSVQWNKLLDLGFGGLEVFNSIVTGRVRNGRISDSLC